MRARQLLPSCGFNNPVLERLEVNEKGLAERKVVDYSMIVLPGVETTDLRACIDAGVNLKEVNSKLFGVREMVTDLSAETETKNEGENTDEQ